MLRAEEISQRFITVGGSAKNWLCTLKNAQNPQKIH